MVCTINEFVAEYRKRYGDQIPIPKAVPSFIEWLNNFTDKIYALGRGDAMQHLEKRSEENICFQIRHFPFKPR